MKKIVWALVVVMLSSCAHKSMVSDDTAPAKIDGPSGEPNSYRVGDENKGPQVTSPELTTIPSEVNPQVEQWVRYFQGRGRKHMERYLARSTRYEGLMKKVLRDNNLPEDLFYIALIESGFSSQAISHASAVGYWQFIRGTGKRFGLEINQLVDERRDPVIATQAAAEYFKDLYAQFGSWYLSMASYNVGEGRVARVIKKYNTKDFWEISRQKRALPKETLNYVPKYLAAKMIAKNPDQYGFEGIDYLPPIEFDHVIVNNSVNLRMMADKLSMNYEDIKALNPKYKGEVAPLKGESIELRIPPGMTQQALIAAQESVVEKVEFIADDNTRLHQIRRGENLQSIARRYRTTVAYLRDMNDLTRKQRLKVGSKIYVPDRTPLAEKRPEYVAKKITKKPIVVEVAGSRVYTVQPGDSLYSIANRYKIGIGEIKRANNFKKGHKLRAGVKIVIPGLDKQGNLDEKKTGSSKTIKAKNKKSTVVASKKENRRKL